MRILIVGNLGYVGPVVVQHLRSRFPRAELIGFDTGLFAHCLTGTGQLPEIALNAQYYGDIREFPPSLLRGVDAVVQLAAISNDPMGNRFETVTDEINRAASIGLAELARDAGSVRSCLLRAAACMALPRAVPVPSLTPSTR